MTGTHSDAESGKTGDPWGSRPAGSIPRSLVVVLTGGIASGKSAAAAEFLRRGVAVHDADALARTLVEPQRPALAEITRAFGTAMLTAEGQLDRRAMRARVFADPAERHRLEAILHPRIHDELRTAAFACSAPYCVLMIPLFAEVHAQYDFVDRVLVVDALPAMQMTRLMQRDRSTEAAAAQILAAQAPRGQRLALADDVVDNSGDLARLGPVIGRLHCRYLAAGAARQRGRLDD